MRAQTARRSAVRDVVALLGRHGATLWRHGEGKAAWDGEAADRAAGGFGWPACRGRLVEISSENEASAALNVAMQLVREAQQAGESVAWVATGASIFFPPDALEAGIDLAALVVVRAFEREAMRWGDRIHTGVQAAEILLDSGGFGLVVLDLAGGGCRSLAPAAQARLAVPAKRRQAALLALTNKPADAPSIGARVGLRWHAHCLPPPSEDEEVAHERGKREGRSERTERSDERLLCARWCVGVETLRDKRGGVERRTRVRARLPLGLC